MQHEASGVRLKRAAALAVPATAPQRPVLPSLQALSPAKLPLTACSNRMCKGASAVRAKLCAHADALQTPPMLQVRRFESACKRRSGSAQQNTRLKCLCPEAMISSSCMWVAAPVHNQLCIAAMLYILACGGLPLRIDATFPAWRAVSGRGLRVPRVDAAILWATSSDRMKFVNFEAVGMHVSLHEQQHALPIN